MALENVTDAVVEDVSTVTDGGAPLDTAKPTVTDLTDDHMVRIPGQPNPVKYGEVYKRLQADHTRKTQEAAKLRAELEKQRTEWQTQREREEQNLKAIAAELLQRQKGGNQQPGNDLLSKLEGLRYLDGPTAAQLYREIQENGIGQVVTAINERDQIIQGMYKQLVGLQRTVQSLQGNYNSQATEGKIKKFVSDLGLPSAAEELAKELYAAYEGDDLDQEFPDILRNRWESIIAAIRAEDKQRVESSRKKPFGVPGKGGAGVAGKAQGLTGKESAKEIADFLFPMVSGE
jgi:hypothetical protein